MKPMVGQPELPTIRTVEELRAALMRGALTGELTGAFRYVNVVKCIGLVGYKRMVKVLSGGSGGPIPHVTQQEYKLILDWLNEHYPPGVNDATDQ